MRSRPNRESDTEDGYISKEEQWRILESTGNVKMEFEKFGGLLAKSRKSIQSGLDDLDDLVGTRSNMIRRQLKNVETSSNPETKMILPEILAVDTDDDT
jgi:DNA recombination protein RmuC